MEEIKYGYYELFGNTVEYFGGDYGLDLDSMEDIPVELIEAMGEFIAEDLDEI